MVRRNLPPVFQGDRSHPMLDDFTLRAARHRARTQPSGIPSCYPLPPRDSPMWEGSGELGNTVDFSPDDNNRQMVLKLNQWGMPEIWTCMLGLSYSDSFGANTAILGVTAELDIGAGGTTQKVEIDWVEGVQFSAPLNALVVTAKYAASASNLPTDIRLSATIGRKPKSNALKPTLSVQVAALVTGGGTVQSAAVRIPAFARRVSVIDRGSAGEAYGANFSIIFVSNNVAGAGSVGQITGAQLQNFMPDGLTIPKFANYIILEARNPAVSVSPTLIFEIDL